jgi:putative spermidine/putrescine transport system ATP-binding protein
MVRADRKLSKLPKIMTPDDTLSGVFLKRDGRTMSDGIELSKLTMDFGSVRAIDNIDLVLPQGQFVCLLGPSGCGKTTLLRMIAGLNTPTSGDIYFDGKSIVDVPSHKRNFGMVFQSLALFPHLTIAENIGYPLRIRGISKKKIAARVEELLDMVHMPGVGPRQISQLSGGQRQRIAIARALAISPKLFLLDEPLSALDAKLREAMQIELRELQRNLGITTVVVTHDQREAMTMADHVVVMKDGKILQYGTPLDIYRKPDTAFVAGFIGSSNLLPCRVTGKDTVEVFGENVKVAHMATGLEKDATAVLSVRPEDMQLCAAQDVPEIMRAKVTFSVDLGTHIEVILDHNGLKIMATVAPRTQESLTKGDMVGLKIAPSICAAVKP